MKGFILILAALSIAPAALAECGSRGGPGWRKPNGQCASWRDVAAPSATPSFYVRSYASPAYEYRPRSAGCGSRGGPGWRKPSGQCASWRD